MMTVDNGREQGHVLVQADGMEVKTIDAKVVKPSTLLDGPKKDRRVDARASLWTKLDALNISYKKNMSKDNLQKLLDESKPVE